MEFIEVGEKATINKIRVICAINNNGGCKLCALNATCTGSSKNRPACFGNERPDNKSIHFLKCK